MDKIKAAEAAIKALKDFIEVEKVNRKAITETAKQDLTDLGHYLIVQCCESLDCIKKEEKQ